MAGKTEIIDAETPAAPFPEVPEMDAEDATRMALARTSAASIVLTENSGVRTFEDAATAGDWPMVHKEALVRQPFAVLGVDLRPIADADGVLQHYLVIFAGAAVKLNGTTITKQGRTFLCVAGRVGPDLEEGGPDNSVAGWEMCDIREIASTSNPVLCVSGYRTVDATLGRYYTVRPEAPKAFEFFPD